MKLPRLENQALSALSRLARRPAQIGELDARVARRLVNNGLVIRYQSIFLITPLGIVLLQRNPMRRLWSKFAAFWDGPTGTERTRQPVGGAHGRPVLVWRA